MENITITEIPYKGKKSLVVTLNFMSKHAVGAAEALRGRVKQLLKYLIKESNLSS